jgi:hypothetical protein
MSIQSIALPLLALIVGLASLFVDPKGKGRKGVVVTLVLALLASCGFAIYSNWKEGINADIRERRIDTLLTTLADFRQETAKGIAGVLEKMNAWGFVGKQVSAQTMESALAAESERERLALQREPEARRSITVRYYPKDVDRDKVEGALRALGFTLQEGRPTLEDIRTNAIWFGESVPIEDVKLVAFTLIRAGVEIVTIRPFRGTGRKPRIIEVGADVQYVGKEPLSVNEIRDATEFTR